MRHARGGDSLMWGWFRSENQEDVLFVRVGQRNLLVVSADACLSFGWEWFSVPGYQPRFLTLKSEDPVWRSLRSRMNRPRRTADSPEMRPILWRQQASWYGTHTKNLEFSDVRVTLYVFRYYCIVLPLALLSAYLFLSKPRSEKKSQLLPTKPDHA